MKIKGVRPGLPEPELLVFPRANGDIAFKVGPIVDNEEFNTLVPEPKPPYMQKRGEGAVPDYNDRDYKKSLDERNRLYFNWLVLKSLSYTEDLEWEKVDLRNPDTWGLYLDELKESGLTSFEINRLINSVTEANSLSEKKLQEARARFLHSQAEMSGQQSSQKEEPMTMQSGGPANVSE